MYGMQVMLSYRIDGIITQQAFTLWFADDATRTAFRSLPFVVSSRNIA